MWKSKWTSGATDGCDERRDGLHVASFGSNIHDQGGVGDGGDHFETWSCYPDPSCQEKWHQTVNFGAGGGPWLDSNVHARQVENVSMIESSEAILQQKHFF